MVLVLLAFGGLHGHRAELGARSVHLHAVLECRGASEDNDYSGGGVRECRMRDRTYLLRSARWAALAAILTVASGARRRGLHVLRPRRLHPIPGTPRRAQSRYAPSPPSVRARRRSAIPATSSASVPVSTSRAIIGPVDAPWSTARPAARSRSAPTRAAVDRRPAGTGADRAADRPAGANRLRVPPSCVLGHHDLVIEGFDDRRLPRRRHSGALGHVGRRRQQQRRDASATTSSTTAAPASTSTPKTPSWSKATPPWRTRASGISVQSCETINEFGTCRGLPSGPVVPIVSNNRSGGNGAHGIFLRDGDERRGAEQRRRTATPSPASACAACPTGWWSTTSSTRNGQEGLSVGRASSRRATPPTRRRSRRPMRSC